MTTQEIITKFNLVEVVVDGKQMLKSNRNATAAEVEIIKAAKPEILAHFAEIRKQAEERLNKIDAIEGLKEIGAVSNEWDDYKAAFERMMESGDSVMNVPMPKTSIDQIKAQYPVAAAYIKASAYSNAANYHKADCGKKALERIINGEDYAVVIADMESEWLKAAEAAVWAN